ncbi:MAG: hypothetical protein SWK76_05700 [Actinomycetota bacterium]|nr:hypothetical protein [Actinomycetota bacterium]
MSGLEALLRAIDPALREEALLIQLEAPQSDQEWLDRLNSLEAALQPTLALLESVDVPPLLGEYESLLMDLFSTLYDLARKLKSLVTGSVANEEVENNPDFINVQELLEIYEPLVGGLYGKLRPSVIDPYIKAVKLEIDRLYLD